MGIFSAKSFNFSAKSSNVRIVERAFRTHDVATGTFTALTAVGF
jgi:hypothetical protein